MELNRIHIFLIVCFAAICAFIILLLIHFWAISLAAFIFIIAIAFMLNDFIEKRNIAKALSEQRFREAQDGKPLDESYFVWEQKEITGQKADQERKETPTATRKKMVRLYAQAFDIDIERATRLYFAGYHDFPSLADASIEELIKIHGINPTLAKRIRNISMEKRIG